MLEPYQMLLVFYRWWELHIDVSFYFPSDPSWVIISQSSFYPVHDDCIMVLFHHFINVVIIFIICIILSLSAMMILSAASFGIIICISSLPWHSRHLHHPIITSAASFGSMICISSLPWHSRHLHHPIITSAASFVISSLYKTWNRGSWWFHHCVYLLCISDLFHAGKYLSHSREPSDCFTITNHPTPSLFQLCWDVWEIKLTL